jgi:hypothetical protein
MFVVRFRIFTISGGAVVLMPPDWSPVQVTTPSGSSTQGPGPALAEGGNTMQKMATPTVPRINEHVALRLKIRTVFLHRKSIFPRMVCLSETNALKLSSNNNETNGFKLLLSSFFIRPPLVNESMLFLPEERPIH